MSQEYTPPQIEDDEIDLAELWRAIWAGKFIIIAITAVFAVSAVFYAKSLPDVYKASVLLAPAQSKSGGLGGLGGQLGGLASLAGVNLGGGGSDKTALALEIIKSRSFIENFITKYDLLIPLMATKGWDRSNNKLLIDSELYDVKNKKWLRETELPKLPEPSPWEAYQKFSELLSISQDKTNSMVTISINHYSPVLAKKWLIALVTEINNFIREQEKTESQGSINYLKNQLKTTEIASMETVFYQLIEEQTKNLMLIEVKKEYVLKTIDPAQVPDIKDSPKRALICISGTILGFIFSVLLVISKMLLSKSDD
ncbi:Wzz/FepE/Etk N-terminal domain-containing protein [Pseudocolwellia sp. HL-MZ19]|uniref:Wzz/FepE/Etk N-terminal domain-containing protein n=1 Tax=Pseudocolwellia sp. HL-MZ19 TaxID=3400846 RepID=UPI003CE712E8